MIKQNEAEISISYIDIPKGPLQLRMSRTSPGRYALHEFAKNIYNVRIADANGAPLAYSRPNPHQWDVPDHNGHVTVQYTLFADRADGTYSGIEETHAHLNIPATFMYAIGFENTPIEVDFQVRKDLHWKVATQLNLIKGNLYSAPDLYYFFDSPAEISNFELRKWEVVSNGKVYSLNLVVHHNGDPNDVDQYQTMVKKVVDEEIAVFGELPDFDFGSYTFLACYLPHVEGDGMEHRILLSLQAKGH